MELFTYPFTRPPCLHLILSIKQGSSHLFTQRIDNHVVQSFPFSYLLDLPSERPSLEDAHGSATGYLKRIGMSHSGSLVSCVGSSGTWIARKSRILLDMSNI